MEGDTKLSSRLGSAALAVTAAAAGSPQLAVTKDSLPVSLITEQILANIIQPLQPLSHLHFHKYFSFQYYSSVSVSLCALFRNQIMSPSQPVLCAETRLCHTVSLCCVQKPDCVTLSACVLYRKQIVSPSQLVICSETRLCHPVSLCSVQKPDCVTLSACVLYRKQIVSPCQPILCAEI